MKKLLLALAIMVLIFGSSGGQNLVYVDDLKDGYTGAGTQVDPYRELQTALEKATNGDKIIILPGTYEASPKTYVEDLCGNCQEHKTTVRASYGFLIKDKKLEISGSGKENTVLVTKAGYGVLFLNSPGSSINNLKITGGIRDKDGNATDAAIVAKFSAVTVRDVLIADNTHRLEGVVVGIGGIFGRENSQLFIFENEIKNNGWDGIALYRGATAYIADNEISTGRGAGIGITWDAVAVVLRNRISGFWKGIGTFGSSCAVVRNNAVFDNLGWGVIATGSSFLEATNNVSTRNGNCGMAVWSEEARGRFANNIVTENGWRKEWVCPCVGIWMYGNINNFSITYNDLWGNVEGNYKDMLDLTGKDGNVSLPPLFTGKNNFVLESHSPLRNIGTPELSTAHGRRPDLGVFGGPTGTIEPR